MVVTARPDLAGAINARLRTSTAIAALTSTRISTSRQTAWGLPSYAVLIETGRGGGEDVPGLKWERVDLLCYGPDARAAHLLWRTVDFFICPSIGSGRASGFTITASGEPVIVMKVDMEGGPLRLTEPDEGWPYTWASYRFTYNAEAGA